MHSTTLSNPSESEIQWPRLAKLSKTCSATLFWLQLFLCSHSYYSPHCRQRNQQTWLAAYSE